MSIDGILTLAQKGTENLEKQTQEQARIQSLLENQQNIMEEVYSSYGDTKEIVEKISEIDELTKSLDENIANGAKFLSDLLTKKPKSQKDQIGDLIGDLIINFQDAALALLAKYISNAEIEIPISEIISIEDEIKSTVDSLIEKGIYIETSTERLDRQRKYQQHVEKLYHLIKGEVHE